MGGVCLPVKWDVDKYTYYAIQKNDQLCVRICKQGTGGTHCDPPPSYSNHHPLSARYSET